MKPDTDVMDTWNTSSLTPYLCYEYYKKMMHPNSPVDRPIFSDRFLAEFMPMSMRPQAHDIIRTWAFYTILKTWMHNDTVPWTSIVISGHVLADSKEKLSKSKDGGKLSPENLLDTYSADAIRYWTASGSLGQDVAFSDNQLKIGQRLVTKMWNAFKFVTEHTNGVDAHKMPAHLGTTNEWLLHTASQTFTSYSNYLEENEFSLALDQVEKFFWHNFCDNYLELIKNQLFNPNQYSAQQVEATRWTLYTVGLRILQMYAPYMPYITETIYQEAYKNNGISSVHQTKFSAIQQEYVFDKSTQKMAIILLIVTTVRRLKTEKQLSLKTPLASLTIAGADAVMAFDFKAEEQMLKGVTQAAEISYAQKGIASELTSEGEIYHAIVMARSENTEAIL